MYILGGGWGFEWVRRVEDIEMVGFWGWGVFKES